MQRRRLVIEREIPRERWPDFCEAFSREHHGWLTTLGVMDTARLRRSSPEAARALVRDAVFQRLRLESGMERLGVGTGSPESVHWAERPVRFLFEQTEGGAHVGLRVDTAEGQSFLLAFRTAARPEQLDGLAEGE